ncbi:hypothetical protein WN48_01917 [Eufriesea mexicana]|uniref:Uncharacterized protein n=1 Tax=Eufriesea mexicana TaxID=516756 RepID=A0A310SR09_9HYME|nr:hypothetical protein WN48_01917 [Eufriesea mexicana]
MSWNYWKGGCTKSEIDIPKDYKHLTEMDQVQELFWLRTDIDKLKAIWITGNEINLRGFAFKKLCQCSFQKFKEEFLGKHARSKKSVLNTEIVVTISEAAVKTDNFVCFELVRERSSRFSVSWFADLKKRKRFITEQEEAIKERKEDETEYAGVRRLPISSCLEFHLAQLDILKCENSDCQLENSHKLPPRETIPYFERIGIIVINVKGLTLEKERKER